MTRFRLFVNCLSVIIILVSLISCNPKPATTQQLTPITVQLLWTHYTQFAGLYAADQKGYYADEGLAVTFIEGGAKVPHFTSVLDGTAQFGIAGADELILERAKGESIKAIGVFYRRSPSVFISLLESGITRPEDFAGKKIRAPANLIPTLKAITSRVGISPDQYTTVDLPSDLARFASGDVPVWGVYLTGLMVDAQLAGYKLNVIYPDDYGVHFYADTLFTTEDTIANDPDLVSRFLRASLKGWTYAVENPEEVPAMVQKVRPAADTVIELAKMTASIPLINTGEDFIGWMKPEIWAGMEKTLREQGVLSSPLDVTQVYTMQFIEAIYK